MVSRIARPFQVSIAADWQTNPVTQILFSTATGIWFSNISGMEDVKRVAFVVKNSDDVWECTRSAIGLGVENLFVGLFIINAIIEMGPQEEDFQDQLEMISDLEGRIFTNVPQNKERYDLVEFMTLKEMAQKIREYDLVTTF